MMILRPTHVTLSLKQPTALSALCELCHEEFQSDNIWLGGSEGTHFLSRIARHYGEQHPEYIRDLPTPNHSPIFRPGEHK